MIGSLCKPIAAGVHPLARPRESESTFPPAAGFQPGTGVNVGGFLALLEERRAAQGRDARGHRSVNRALGLGGCPPEHRGVDPRLNLDAQIMLGAQSLVRAAITRLTRGA